MLIKHKNGTFEILLYRYPSKLWRKILKECLIIIRESKKNQRRHIQ